MPLALDLKHGDKIIINGAVIENSGHNTQILIHNDAAILRGREIMTEGEATTPAGRAYFALQCAYIFPASRQNYLQAFDVLLMDYVTACPSARPIAHDIAEKLRDGSLYAALKSARKLVAHESKLMRQIGIDVTEKGFIPIAEDGEAAQGAVAEGGTGTEKASEKRPPVVVRKARPPRRGGAGS